MNRPRNRQPRPPPNRAKERNTNRPLTRQQPSQGSSDVPTTQQVKPGASVSIVLKADQRTGREVQGIVQDLLTRGDHPRGIKVRLQDGRIGRVQRMTTAGSSNVSNISETQAQAVQLKTSTSLPKDVSRHGGGPDSSASSIAEDRSDVGQESDLTHAYGKYMSLSSNTVKCPFCNDFEGDEAAVSHHVQEHLDQGAPP